MTTKTTWENLKRSSLIYIRTSEPSEAEVWMGPYIVEDPIQRMVNSIGATPDFQPFLAPEGTPAVYMVDESLSPEKSEIGDLSPVPQWIKGQEHDPNPLVLEKFTHEKYQEALEAIKLGVFSHDIQRKAHLVLIKMWEEAVQALLKDGKVLSHINMYSGGMMRCFWK